MTPTDFIQKFQTFDKLRPESAGVDNDGNFDKLMV